MKVLVTYNLGKGGVSKTDEFLEKFQKGGGTVVNFWPPCGNSPTVQNVYILVQFVSKID